MKALSSVVEFRHSPHVERCISRYREFQNIMLRQILQSIPPVPKNRFMIQQELEKATSNFRNYVLKAMSCDTPSVTITKNGR